MRVAHPPAPYSEGSHHLVVARPRATSTGLDSATGGFLERWGWRDGLGSRRGSSSAVEGSVVATAILDRLVHHDFVLTIRSKSYRHRDKRWAEFLYTWGGPPAHLPSRCVSPMRHLVLVPLMSPGREVTMSLDSIANRCYRLHALGVLNLYFLR